MKGFVFFGLFTMASSALIKGINFFGLETPAKNFDCAWAHDVSFYVDQLVAVGYNSFRVPWSVQYAEEGDFSRLDHLVDVVGKHPNVSILLDAHRVFNTHQAPDPYEGGDGTLNRFVNAWKTVLGRYVNDLQVEAADVFNEYQGTDVGFWNGVLEQVVTQIEDAYPGRYYYLVGGTNWGGSLAGINLEHLAFSARIFYTIHKYKFSGEDWDASFGNFHKKVIIGEWGGFFSTKQEDAEWANRFIDWCIRHGVRDSYFWTAVCNSGDTGGVYRDCENFDYVKQSFVKRLWSGVQKGNLLRGSCGGNATHIKGGGATCTLC